MIKSLFTLSNEYKDKKIVVYGVNRTSVNLFTDLALNYSVDVYAFLDMEDKFTGESFVNRPVINISQLKKLADAILIIPEINEKQNLLKYTEQKIEILYKNEILDFNEELRNQKIYLYGIGNNACWLYDKMQDKGIAIEGVCVTTPGSIEEWCGKRVISAEQMKRESNCSVILASDIEQYINEMLEQLDNCDMIKYIFYFMSKNVILNMNFFQIINIALNKKKKIWLYDKGDEHAQYLKKVLSNYQVEIVKEIDEESIYELGYENIDDISVIVAEKNAEKSEWVCDVLDSLGFGLERLDYTSTNWCTCKANWSALVIKRDILLGRAIYVNDKYPGYDVYGNEKLAKVKIMILGGSTSTSNVYRTVSWVECFYHILSEAGYCPVIYNGAMCSYRIVDEYLHMLRDIEPLKPDFVISFSGVNNTSERKVVNQFNTSSGDSIICNNSDVISGIKSDEPLYEFWYRVSKLIRLTAEYHGAKVYNFLQPMNSTNESYDLIQKGMFELTEHEKYIEDYKVKASAESDPIYFNLSSMLDGKKQMYIDMCHYSTEANRLIAKRVFEIMKRDLNTVVNIN